MAKEVTDYSKNIFKKNYIIIVMIVFILAFFISIFFIWLNKPYVVNKNFNKINLKNVDKLMIVAHPDDELLWGGGHLIEDDYLVVCITCGTSKIRALEFKKVMKNTKDKYIMLGYPDKTNGVRNNWLDYKNDIIADLEKIINLKDWKLIVTHNPEGEYGHQHHKMTSEFVTYLQHDKTKLYYFGHYYSKKRISAYISDISSIKDETLAKKENLIGLYKSQKFIQTAFDHMYEHEDWQLYNEWMSDLNEKTN